MNPEKRAGNAPARSSEINTRTATAPERAGTCAGPLTCGFANRAGARRTPRLLTALPPLFRRGAVVATPRQATR